MSFDILRDVALGGVVGAALGAVHMLWLWRASARLGPEGGGALALVGGAVLRLALVLAGFAGLMALAAQPAVAMVSALVAFTAVRMIAVRRARKG